MSDLPWATSSDEPTETVDPQAAAFDVDEEVIEGFIDEGVTEEVIEEEEVDEEVIGSYLEDNKEYILNWNHPVDTFNENAYGIPLEEKDGEYTSVMTGARAKLELNRDNPQRFTLPEPK